MVIALLPVHEPRESKACPHLGQLSSLQIGLDSNFNVYAWRRTLKEFAQAGRSTAISLILTFMSSLYTQLSSSLSFASSSGDLRKCLWMVIPELILGFRSEISVCILIRKYKPTVCIHAQICKESFPQYLFYILFFWEEKKTPSSLKLNQISFHFLKYSLCFQEKKKKKGRKVKVRKKY